MVVDIGTTSSLTQRGATASNFFMVLKGVRWTTPRLNVCETLPALSLPKATKQT